MILNFEVLLIFAKKKCLELKYYSSLKKNQLQRLPSCEFICKPMRAPH